jgi:hypothetical protein
MKPTYFGPLVRIVYRGPGPDHDLEVQRWSEVSGDWHQVRTFDHNFDFAWSDARLFAAELSYRLRREVNA